MSSVQYARELCPCKFCRTQADGLEGGGKQYPHVKTVGATDLEMEKSVWNAISPILPSDKKTHKILILLLPLIWILRLGKVGFRVTGLKLEVDTQSKSRYQNHGILTCSLSFVEP